MTFDLFNAPPLDNDWRSNRGTFNLDARAASSMSMLGEAVAEALAAGGCLYQADASVGAR